MQRYHIHKNKAFHQLQCRGAWPSIVVPRSRSQPSTYSDRFFLRIVRRYRTRSRSSIGKQAGSLG